MSDNSESSNAIVDMFKNISDRLTNPLIFSFLCSWLIYNWQIVIAVVWHDTTQTDGKTIFDFVLDRLAKPDSTRWPIGFALIYTLIMPPIKNGIRVFNFWLHKVADDGIETIGAQKNFQRDQEFIRKLYDRTFIYGNWKYRLGGDAEKRIKIENDKIYEILPNQENVHIANINDFQYDCRNDSIFFVKSHPQHPDKFNVVRIGFKTNDILKGQQDYLTRVEFERN